MYACLNDRNDLIRLTLIIFRGFWTVFTANMPFFCGYGIKRRFFQKMTICCACAQRKLGVKVNCWILQLGHYISLIEILKWVKDYYTRLQGCSKTLGFAYFRRKKRRKLQFLAKIGLMLRNKIAHNFGLHSPISMALGSWFNV